MSNHGGYENQSRSLRDTISARAIEVLSRIVMEVESKEVSVDTGFYAVKALVESLSPFCTPDVSEIIGEAERTWRFMISNRDLIKQQASVNSSFQNYVAVPYGDF
jgi:hypothetical protein